MARAHLLALGDSYTIGEGVAPDERWPAHVVRRLERAGLDVHLQVVAQTGWTADELAAAIGAADVRGPFDVVTLLIGVNDQYRGRSAEAYRDPFRTLLQRAVAFAGGVPGRVVVVSIPDWSGTPFAAAPPPDGAGDRDPALTARAIDAFNAVARDEARRAGAHWVDVTPLSRTQGDQTVKDGLHPTGEAYAAWAERITPVVRVALTPAGS